MYRVFFCLLLVLGASCQYFDTERISSEEVLEEELSAMDWADIDTYPAFPGCEGIMEKQRQRTCFENTILSSVSEQLAQGNWVTSFPLSDTVFLQLQVDTLGMMVVEPIQMDSLLRTSLPKLDSLLVVGILQLQTPTPAYKRGIPVNSKFMLPVVINTEEL